MKDFSQSRNRLNVAEKLFRYKWGRNEDVNIFQVVNYERIGPPTDMWGVGVICYILLSGKIKMMVAYLFRKKISWWLVSMLLVIMICAQAFPRSWERRMERRSAISTGDASTIKPNIVIIIYLSPIPFVFQCELWLRGARVWQHHQRGKGEQIINTSTPSLPKLAIISWQLLETRQDFISSLLTRRPHLRLTAVASLLHDWLQVGSGYWLLVQWLVAFPVGYLLAVCGRLL